MALALILLVTSGLMIRTFRNLHHVDPGFTNAAEIQTVRIAIPDEQVKEPERVVRMEQAMLDKISAIDGVSSVSITSSVTMGGSKRTIRYTPKIKRIAKAPLRRCAV